MDDILAAIKQLDDKIGNDIGATLHDLDGRVKHVESEVDSMATSIERHDETLYGKGRERPGLCEDMRQVRRDTAGMKKGVYTIAIMFASVIVKWIWDLITSGVV